LGRNIYIKDATGGLLIFDNSPTSVITTTYNNGDVISGGVIGTCTRYNGMFEMIPLFNLAAGTPGTPVEPEVLTMANLLANFIDYESQLVKLENIKFGEVKTLGLSSTAAGANVAILQGTDEMIMRNNYNTITGYTSNPNSLFHVTGFIVPYVTNTANDKQICPRDTNDIFEVEFTLTFKNWDNSVIATQTYHYGETVVPPANPTRPSDNTYSYTFSGWNPTVVTPVVGDATYTATYTQSYINYTLTVLASPPTGGNVTGGSNTFHYGDNAYLAATANTGYTFSQWNDGNTNPTRTVIVTGNATYTATFTPITYTIVYNGNTNTGGATASSIHTYDVAKTLTPNGFTKTGYTFAGWATSPTGAKVYDDAQSVINLTNVNGTTINLYATWTVNTYILTLDPSTGTVNGSSVPITIPIVYGTAITTLPSAVQSNCTFTGWYIGATKINIGDVWTYTSNQTAIAVFNYPITVTNNTPALGNINPATTQNYLLNQTPAYTCTPNPGAYIVSILVDGALVFSGINGTTAPYTYTFAPINTNHSIAVTFAPNCYPLNLGTIAPGVTVTPTSCVPHGSTNVTLTFNANCAEITKVTIGGVNMGAITSYTIPSVTGPLPLIDIEAITIQYPIVATGSNDMGTITPDGTTIVDCGTNITYNFVTELGYRVSTLVVDGVSVPVPASKSYTFTNVKAPHTIHVEFEEFPYYIIQFGPDASQNAGGVVYPTLFPGALYYVAVDSATVAYSFSIVPDAGYMIDHVYVDNFNNAQAVQTGTYTFYNLHGHHTIYATFKPIMHTITATTTVGGNINPSGAVQVSQGSDQTFFIYPNEGYHLLAVYMDDNIVSTGDYTFYNVQANHSIHAVFAINTYTITPSAGANGTISPNTVQTVNHGTNKTFTFSPANGYKVNQVLIDGTPDAGAALAGNYTFLNISDNHTIHVTFTKQTYMITSTSGPNGTVTPLGVEYVDYWEHSEVYTFDPAPGYHIKQVLVDGKNDPLAVFNQEYRFLNVSENHILNVFFAKNEFTITATATQGGAINPAGKVTVPNGENKTFFINPSVGYKLIHVIVDGINQEEAVNTGMYIFEDISADHTISAQFEKVSYEVILPDAEGAYVIATGGSISPVASGGKYTFVVEMKEGYTACKPTLVVRANGMVLNPVAGEYVISPILSDQIVTIEGIKLNTYQIVAKAENGGDIKPAGTFVVTHGESKTFEILAHPKYAIADVVINGESKGVMDSYTFNNVKENATLTAYFNWSPVGIDENEASLVVFSHRNMITIENKELVPVKQVDVMDMYGRLVWTGQALGEKTEITLNVANGIYNVRILTEAGFATTKVSITK